VFGFCSLCSFSCLWRDSFSVHSRKVFRKAFAVDLAYYLLNNLLPKLLLVAPVAVIAWALHHVVPEQVHSWTGGLRLHNRLLLSL
jgi:pyridoxine/pyridoxamine 5'-phosphate oxidase